MRKRQSTRIARKSFTQRMEERILTESAKTAGWNAARSSRALGLTVKIIKDNEIIAVQPDKSERVVRGIRKSSVDISKLKKGSVLRKK